MPHDQPTPTYSDELTEVRLGDRVRCRVLFRMRTGRVIYIPGVSPRQSEMEFNGLIWVGLQFDDGMVIKEIVLPDTHRLRDKVHFEARGSEEDIPVILELGGPEDEEDEPEAEETPVAPPRVVDWIAAGVSFLLLPALVIGAVAVLALLVRACRDLF